MTDENQKEGVYGENSDPSEGTTEPGIREEIVKETPDKGDTAEDLEEARQEMIDATGEGGMGRPGTPKDGPSQGGWQRPEEPVESPS